MPIDLHTHSTASDGLLTPADLLQAAHAAGLDVLALTDHDTTDGIAEAQTAGATYGIEVIAGIEINTNLPGGGRGSEVHVLGYFVNRVDAEVRGDDSTKGPKFHEGHERVLPIAASDVAFQAQLAQRRAARLQRGQQMVAKLQAIGIPITWEQVLRHAHGAVGRPHIAAALMELHIVRSVAEAFDRYLAPGMPGFVPREPFNPIEAITLIRSAQGVPSLAHPATIPALEERLPAFIAAGMAGLETYYGTYAEETVDRLLALCHQYALVPTGGSDYHGPGIHPTPLGGRAVPEGTVAALRARLG